jgi:hypothetical protein
MKIDADGLDEHARVLLARGVLSAMPVNVLPRHTLTHGQTHRTPAASDR